MEIPLGKKLAALRNQKGWSQELLAENAQINLRTLQRIETGQSSPRGDTLRRLSKALETDLEVLFDEHMQEDPGMLMLLHLSVLSFPLVPLGNIIFPAIIWISRRDKTKHMQAQGRNLLNTQIIFTLFWNALLGITMYMRYAKNETELTSYMLLSLGFLGILNILYPLFSAWQVRRRPKRLMYPSWGFI